MMRRARAIARLETLRLRHDRTSLALVFSVPALQVLLFGGAIDVNPTQVSLAIAGAPQSGALTEAIAETGKFRIVADGLPTGAAEHAVRAGQALVGLERAPPPQTEADADAPARPARLVVDGTDPLAVGAAVAALESRYLRERLATAGPVGAAAPVVEWLYNPARRTAWTLMPALAGAIVMISSLLLGALSLVREREGGHWEMLLASPATATDLIAGKLAPYLLIATLQAAAVLLLAHAVFGVPFAGAVGTLLLCTPLFALAHLLLGFAISAAAATQVQAIQGAVFFYLPCMLLSGFLFPYSAMPGWARALGAALPLTHWTAASRAALLRGEGPGAILARFLPVALFALVAGLLARAACGRRLA